jgi:hypothetical protein
LREEEQYIDIRGKLLNLPKVKAGDDFMKALQRKINLAEAEESQKKISEGMKESFWIKLFGKNRNPWLIPSLSLTIVAIFVISVYVLNSKKINEIPTVSDFQKKESPSGVVQENQRIEKDETSGQDVTSDITQEYQKKNLKTPPVTDTKNTEQPLQTTIPAPVEMRMDEIPSPSNSEPVKSETEKIEYKKEDRIYQDMEKNEQKEIMKSRGGNLKNELPFDKAIQDEEKDKIDVTKTKGLIDKKKANATKKAAKTESDSTKIDKGVLEKIKKEIEKK